MTFDEVLAQVRELLQSKGRVAYRALKRRFDLDDDYLEDLKAELIKADRVAEDEDGEVLVWVGGTEAEQTLSRTSPQPQPPLSYTPPHLAERILAEQAAIEARGTTDGERKTITAVFSDLKGATALIEGLDPEEARAIIDINAPRHDNAPSFPQDPGTGVAADAERICQALLCRYGPRLPPAQLRVRLCGVRDREAAVRVRLFSSGYPMEG